MKRLLGALEILLPALMAVLVFIVLSDILYSGGKRENLAAKAEKLLIESSLRFAAYDARTPGAVLTVSYTDADRPKLAAAPSSLVRDASLAEYAAVAKALLAKKPRLLVISWLTSAQPTDAAAWQPLVEALRTAPDPSAVLIAYPIAEIDAVPAEVRQEFRVMEGEDCVYEVNSYCTYNPKWSTWLIQELAVRLWPTPPPHHVSDNLPHVLPNFLLHAPRRASIPDVSFGAVLAGAIPDDRIAGRVVFLGNDATQDRILRDNKSILRRTYTASDAVRPGSLLERGTPLHVFWAQMAQMFLDGETIAIAPDYAEVVALVLMGVAILFIMSRAGQAASVAFLIFALIAAPTLNALSVKYLHAYLPIFLAGYGAALVYLFSAFGLMSFNNFRRHRLAADRKAFALTADLNANFVSLLSHNLITPVAKLLGLIDVLIAAKRLPHETENLGECRSLVTQMQFFARSTLLATSTEQTAGRKPERANLKTLLAELDRDSKPLLARLGIDLRVAPLEDEAMFTPVRLDPRLGAHALAAMAMLLGRGRKGIVRCELTLEPPADDDTIATLTLAAVAPEGASLTAPTRALLAAPESDEGDSPTSVLMHYVRTFAQANAGSLEVVPAPEARLTLKLKVGT